MDEGDTSEPVFTVKVYDNVERTINSMVEIYGFLSITPKRSEACDTPMEHDEFGESTVNDDQPEFVLHAIDVKSLPHNNPLLYSHCPDVKEFSIEEIYRDLIKLLKTFMFGDEIAAHYLLCHLISTVYTRINGETLGKFSLNLTCQSIPKDILPGHVKKLYNLIETLMPNSIYLPLSIESLNTTRMVPKKDYKTNRLTTGLLQLPDHTQIVIDETTLGSGKLDSNGCVAVADLTELIRNQQISYDFKFYKLPFNTNFPVMIYSEGKSFLPSDFIVPIKVSDDDSIRLINENIAAAIHFLKPKLNAIRRYLTECRILDFKIGEDETKLIENDFVKMREEKNLEIEHLHSLLVISRLVGISRGRTALDLSSWEIAKNLEFERINRIGKQGAVNES